MEILKNGKDKEYIITCSTCDSDLMYKAEDIKIDLVKCNNLGIWAEGKLEYTDYSKQEYIICPVCKKQINIITSLKPV